MRVTLGPPGASQASGGPLSIGHVIDLPTWPGRAALKTRPPSPFRSQRLVDRPAMVLLVIAERGARSDEGYSEERFGLGAYLLIHGRSVTTGGIIFPAGREEIRAIVESWCATHMIDTLIGPKYWSSLSLSEFFDYKKGLFTQQIYCGGSWLISMDLGRTLGLCTQHWGKARGTFWRDGFTIYLPTWCRFEMRNGRDHVRPVSPHRPPIHIRAIGPYGYMAAFARPGGDGTSGRRNRDGSAYQGRFIDLIPLGSIFDGIDSHEASDHLHAFAISSREIPTSLPIDGEAIEILSEAVLAAHDLALSLDHEASLWL